MGVLDLMAKFSVGDGIDKYINKLSNLEFQGHEVIGRCVYEGAGIVADAMRRELQAIPVTVKHGTEADKIDGCTPAQKAGLLEGFGISHMQDDGGYYHVKLGFQGYNNQRTKAYPGGQPNSVIARSIDSGTSFRKARHFVNRAVNATKSQAEKAMAEQFDKEVEQIMK